MINNRQSGRRRGRGGSGSGSGRAPNMGSNPGNRQDNRQRGNAAQLLEKYKNMARDAQMQGDRVQTEYFLQFADHYFRVLGESRARYEEQRRQRGDDYGDEDEQELEVEGVEGGVDLSEDNEPRRAPPRREARQDREPRQDRELRQERAPRQDREPRPDREPREEREPREARAPREEREDREGRNGEYRTARRPRARRPEESEGGANDERIALEALPPAISTVANDADAETAKAPRARRPRRPRATDEDIAPAA